MANTFKRKLSKSVGTTAVIVGATASNPSGGYIVPAATTTTVIGLSVANITTSDVTVDIMLNDGASDHYLNKNCLLPAGTTIVSVGGDQKVILMSGDSVKVQASVNDSVDVVMSILELTA